MKVYDIFEGTGRLTRDAVRRAVWSSYADDPFYSVSGDPNDLDDDDFDDFERHVDDVFKFARANNITNPTSAAAAYIESIAMRPTFH